MTPERAALVAAAQRESARVYGQLCREHKADAPDDGITPAEIVRRRRVLTGVADWDDVEAVGA